MIFDRPGSPGDFERILILRDPPSGLRAIIALHSTRRGPAFGGIRRRTYPDDLAALDDALRLAAAMTDKCARAGLPAGGGKTVVLDHPDLDIPAAYAALGEAIESLAGTYYAGPDVGTGAPELNAARPHTRYLNLPNNNAGAATAQGVLAALRGTLPFLDATQMKGLHVVVQGAGDVGLRVLQGLLEQGAHVSVAEPQEARLQLAVQAGAHAMDVEQATHTPCDLFVPCALGGVLTKAVAQRIPTRAICGSANNIVAHDAAPAILRDRGVLLVPDVVSSAGAVIEGVLSILEGDTPEVRERIRARIEATEARVQESLGRWLALA